MTLNLGWPRFNSHDTEGEKCVEFVKTLHVKFFPFGSFLPSGIVTVKGVPLHLVDIVQN